MCYNTPTNTGEAGNVTKERDYAKEYQREKARRAVTETRIGVKLTPKIASDFENKCKANGATRNAVLRRYIERYTYEDFDQ